MKTPHPTAFEAASQLEVCAVRQPQFLEGYMTRIGVVITSICWLVSALSALLPPEAWLAIKQFVSDKSPMLGVILGGLVTVYGVLRRQWRNDTLGRIIDPYEEEADSHRGPFDKHYEEELEAGLDSSTLSPGGTGGKTKAAAHGGDQRAVTIPLLVLLATGLLTSCATQNSPIQQAIAERLKGSVIGAPAGVLVGGATAIASAPRLIAAQPLPFGGFYAAPLHINQEVAQ